MVLPISLGEQSYNITVERGALSSVGKIFNLNRRVLILTDSGVPREYSERVLAQCKSGYIFTIPMGEASKNFDSFKDVLGKMVELGFTRTDCVVSVGGGVCGDLGGFVASAYMRGVDFYNVPTTLLSQVDSSIGGKTAVDFCGVKNIVGAFYQPKGVVVDPDTLKTLDKRQVHAGLCEAIKMAATCDKALFDFIAKSDDLERDIEEIIVRSLKIKGDVVEKDPKEKNLRKVLNFGHTIGHAVEALSGKLLHGECVGIGMLYMCAPQVKKALVPVLEKYELPREFSLSDEIMSFIERDKKASGDEITVVFVSEIGTFELRKIKISEIQGYINGEI